MSPKNPLKITFVLALSLLLAAPQAWGQAPAAPGGRRPPQAQPKPWLRHSWALFPGTYRTYDGKVSGFELTYLPSGALGACLGIEKRGLRYIEAELALWVISFGVGLRRSDKGHADFQATVAFPLLPIFPYMRFHTASEGNNAEYGFMIKLPLFFGNGEQEASEERRHTI